jgi:hypothetical protein
LFLSHPTKAFSLHIQTLDARRIAKKGFLWHAIDFGVKYLLRSEPSSSEYCIMQNRSKILILLFTATLVVGTLTLWHSRNDSSAVEDFKSLFSGTTLYDLKKSLPSVTVRACIWYGGISLFSVIMILLVVRAARRNGSRRPPGNS